MARAAVTAVASRNTATTVRRIEVRILLADVFMQDLDYGVF
jgi:hypothetical protein